MGWADYLNDPTLGWLPPLQAEAAAVEAARIAVLTSQLKTATQQAVRGNVAAMRLAIALLAKIHRFTVEVREAMPAGVSAFADWQRRHIVVPPIVDESTFAVCLHEAGHILAGRCPGIDPHRPDPSVTRWHHCLACESSAWEIGSRLVPFTREMHGRLGRSLKTYRGTTPGPASEVERLDRLAGDVAWRLDQQRRRRWDMRLEFVGQWKRESIIRRTP